MSEKPLPEVLSTEQLQQREEAITEQRIAARKVAELSVTYGNGYFVWAGDMERLRLAIKALDAASQPQEGRS